MIVPRRAAQRGTSLVEVLVTIVITAIGLLGLAGMQSRLQISEVESYQRAQALLLLEDMASKISTNRAAAADYVTDADPLGAGITCPAADEDSTRAQIDASEWCVSLQGAAELRGGNRVGAMIGARGCVQQLADDDYLLTVAWEGQAPLTAPPGSVDCAQGLYDDGASCVEDRCRRAVTTIIRAVSLD
jgi:type IV pilus assembly protein PilV